MKQFILPIFALMCLSTLAQKKVLDHPDFDIWNTVKGQTISTDGNYVMYSLERGETDNFLKIKSPKGETVFNYDRASKGQFTNDAKQALFTIKPWHDSIVALKRKKVKKSKLPKDSLGIYNLATGELDKIGHIKSYKLPAHWSGYVFYQLGAIKSPKKEVAKDSTSEEKPKKIKKVGKDNGYHLVVRNLTTKAQDTFKYVTNYSFAKKEKVLAFTSTGDDADFKAGAYVYNLETKGLTQVLEANAKAKYYQLQFSENGERLGFVVDKDTTKVQVRPNQLYSWAKGMDAAKLLMDKDSAPRGFRVSSDGSLSFSKDATKLYFGLATPPIVKDTTLIDEEIVNVEVWTYDEPRLYTVQELQVKNDRKKSYQTAYHLATNKVVPLASPEYPSARLGNEGNAAYALVNTPKPYQLQSQWEGSNARDYALVNVNTGTTTSILKKIKGRINLSPNGKYAFGYSITDSTWFTYNVASNKRVNLTKGIQFYDELNDYPNYPYSYGYAGWTTNDAEILIYDRYDIWAFNPDTGAKRQLTHGRSSKTSYRYEWLDDELRYIPSGEKWIFSTFNEANKDAGYYEYNSKTNKGKQLVEGAYRFRRLQKAQHSDAIIYSRESFKEFPNVRYSDLSFKKSTVLSDANPQQDSYNWGTIELVEWTSLDGKPLQGMLVKPENFDPNKKYPMIVNFYETSSDRLHQHKAPNPGRSTINYSFYASRGYLIFNPDVHYRVGYPGESALNCVIPGVTALIEQGFVDKDNIGVQGHSWGGYQIAYLVTKTDMFKAAESGAPVPNMISAYGGIRWWTGLSRQFQYEHTQSRIGGTPWEYPQRYIENSPIFNIDKINTPLLIMHNDADGHVPWYQGIEFFVSLRRLGKPSWFLNYNDEPHWPLKMQNRKDFNIRMQQYFDYYLKGAAKPVWMERGVPAIEKGINQGLELMETKTN